MLNFLKKLFTRTKPTTKTETPDCETVIFEVEHHEGGYYTLPVNVGVPSAATQIIETPTKDKDIQ